MATPPPSIKVTLAHPAFTGPDRDIAFLTCAPTFDPGGPFFIVLFFHGFVKPLDEQVVRHDLANQVARSGRNCVLVCPRISLNDGTGNNPGKFKQENQVEGFLDELAEHITTLKGHGGLHAVRAMAAKAPLLLATFSGGHSMASQFLIHDVSNARTECCAFFDSLYGSDLYFREPREVLKTAGLAGIHRTDYDKTPGSHEFNRHKDLKKALVTAHVEVATSLDDVTELRAGVAVLQAVAGVGHWDIVSRGSPLQHVLSKFAAKDGLAYELPPSPNV
ncbi:MAG: hypothetical protein KIS73_19885 [Enhydrobacter sp.]|nr:hypothetical protein [Enhydrobacter sp.]